MRTVQRKLGRGRGPWYTIPLTDCLTYAGSNVATRIYVPQRYGVLVQLPPDVPVGDLHIAAAMNGGEPAADAADLHEAEGAGLMSASHIATTGATLCVILAIYVPAHGERTQDQFFLAHLDTGEGEEFTPRPREGGGGGGGTRSEGDERLDRQLTGIFTNLHCRPNEAHVTLMSGSPSFLLTALYDRLNDEVANLRIDNSSMNGAICLSNIAGGFERSSVVRLADPAVRLTESKGRDQYSLGMLNRGIDIKSFFCGSWSLSRN